MKLTRSGSHIQRFILALGFAFAVGFALLSALTRPSSAQNAATATTQSPAATAPSLPCTITQVLPSDPSNKQKDPFSGKLAGSSLPTGLLPINEATRTAILEAGLPCQESVSPFGQETVGLDNLQRGFDFYSWRTFIFLNSPADGTSILAANAETRTRWEDMANFKQLLDVMLPANLEPASWPTDRAGMEAESERLVPQECRVLHSQMPERMVVKMIEESFNEPFSTGPLIDQNGRYAIFDILMNRQMFDYIMRNHLNSKAGQAANSDLAVDFPAGTNGTAPNHSDRDLGAFMLKVSWKILSDKEIAAKTFHTVEALVLTPPIPNETRKCLPETLGLIGFHAVHKTATRPQWIWTSFEHVRNVPDSGEIQHLTPDDTFNFYKVNCVGACTVNATPPKPWDPDPALELRFRRDDSFKSQIVRVTPLTPAANNMNVIFQSMLANTVWKNYMLISTQWPTNTNNCTKLQSAKSPDPKTDFLKQPDMTCSPAPPFMANSTLETYSQGDIPLASSSCIACHENAVDFQKSASNRQKNKPNLNQSDFTFILEKAQ